MVESRDKFIASMSYQARHLPDRFLAPHLRARRVDALIDARIIYCRRRPISALARRHFATRLMARTMRARSASVRQRACHHYRSCAPPRCALISCLSAYDFTHARHERGRRLIFRRISISLQKPMLAPRRYGIVDIARYRKCLSRL